MRPNWVTGSLPVVVGCRLLRESAEVKGIWAPQTYRNLPLMGQTAYVLFRTDREPFERNVCSYLLVGLKLTHGEFRFLVKFLLTKAKGVRTLSLAELDSSSTPKEKEDQLGKRTIVVSDLSGQEIPEGKGAVIRISFGDARKGVRELDVTEDEAIKLGEHGRTSKRRGRKPGRSTPVAEKTGNGDDAVDSALGVGAE